MNESTGNNAATVEQPTVLSQSDKEPGEKSSVPESKSAVQPKPELTEDERVQREHNRMAAQRRIEQRQWKRKLAELETGQLSEEDRKLVLESAARGKGLDINDEGSKKQAEFVIDATREQMRLQAERGRAIKIAAANEILSATLSEIGYEPNSPAFMMAGSMLFRSVGIDDPDKFADRQFVAEQLEAFSAALLQKRKPADQVDVAIVARAGAPRPSSESREKPPSDDSNEPVKQASQKYAVRPTGTEQDGIPMSEETAKVVVEKQKKLPSWAR